MLLTEPFRGSAAVAAGLVTPAQLRGRRFRRIYRGIFVASHVDVAVRSRAAALLTGGVLGGWSAAELLGPSCGPENAPAEVVVPGGRCRNRRGLIVRDAALGPDEVTHAGSAPVTTPLRTAFDLARRAPLIEAVVAVDALTHAFDFAPQELITFGYGHFGARGSAQLVDVVRLANPLAGSPMETRIRFAMHEGGLPAPVLQHPVGPYLLDLAYPEIRLAVEYDGREHLTQERAMRDLDRQAYISTVGWHVLRFRKGDVLYRRWVIPRTVGAKLTGMIAAS